MSCMEINVCSNVGANFLPSPIVPMIMPSPAAISTGPSPPRMLTTTGVPTGSTVELNWLPPLHPNGAIHYEIEYEPAMTPGGPVNAGNSSSPYFTLTLPNEFLTYNVRVAAVNTQGTGLARSDVLPVYLRKNREEGVLWFFGALIWLWPVYSVRVEAFLLTFKNPLTKTWHCRLL